MSSDGTPSDRRSTISPRRGPTGRSSLFGAVAHLPVSDVVGDPRASLAHAAAAVERLEREIDHLWFDSMEAEDLAMAHRLAEISHALQRAARLLEPDNAR